VQLKRWYQDWADALRPELGYHDQVRLGLRARAGGRSSGRDADGALDKAETTPA
jgi:hypothetical protein